MLTAVACAVVSVWKGRLWSQRYISIVSWLGVDMLPKFCAPKPATTSCLPHPKGCVHISFWNIQVLNEPQEVVPMGLGTLVWSDSNEKNTWRHAWVHQHAFYDETFSVVFWVGKKNSRTFQLDCGQLRKTQHEAQFSICPPSLVWCFCVLLNRRVVSLSHDVNTMQKKNIYSFSYSCFDHVLMLFLWSTLRDNRVHLLDPWIRPWSLSFWTSAGV